jgi:[histone H3]-lysine36 N-dimethyltransferase SETMAR
MEVSKECARFYVFTRLQLGDSATKIHADLVAVHGNSAPSYPTVARWISKFQGGSHQLSDEGRSGRPSDVTTPEAVGKIRDLLAADARLTISMLSHATGISEKSVHRILHEKLVMKKICARWVPHLLTEEEKNVRVHHARGLLNAIQHRLADIVTGDESWFYYHQTPSKHLNMVWLQDGEPRPEICRPSFRSRKRMLSIFINSRGPVAVDVLPEQETITGNYYAQVVLPKVFAGVKEQRPLLGTTRTLLHHDNASPHKTKQVQEVLQKNKVTVVPHPPYSPDLAPLDFWLFPKIKESLSGRSFHRVQDLARAVNSQLRSIPQQEYRSVFQKWNQRLQTCIQVNGGYVEGLR